MRNSFSQICDSQCQRTQFSVILQHQYQSELLRSDSYINSLTIIQYYQYQTNIIMSNSSRSNSSSISTRQLYIKMSEPMVQIAQKLCKEHVPGLSYYTGVKTVQDRGRVFIFVTSRVLWHKLRVFSVDWFNKSVNPFSKIQYVEIKELNKNSVTLLESHDCLSTESLTNKMEEWVDKIRTEEILTESKTSNEIYEPRFSTYQKKKEELCADMPLEKLIVNRATKNKGEEEYECRIFVDFHGLHFILRLVCINNVNHLGIYSKSEHRHIRDFGETAKIAVLTWDQVMDIKRQFLKSAKIACHLHQTMIEHKMKLNSLAWTKENTLQLIYNSEKTQGFNVTLNLKDEKLKTEFDIKTLLASKTLNFDVFCANLTQATVDLKNHLIQASEIADGSDLTISTQLDIPEVKRMSYATSISQAHKN